MRLLANGDTWGVACLGLALTFCAITGSPSRAEGPTDGPPQSAQCLSQAAVLENWVERTAAENGPEYTGIFTELGVRPEDQAQLKSQIADLHRKAIAAGEPMRELLEARIAYDKAVRAALGDKNYDRYRSFEDSKPAKREYELIREFAASSNKLVLDAAYYDKIVSLIRESDATTTETWHGPYDPRPHPEVGMQMCLAETHRQLASFRQASTNLTTALPKSGLPEDYQRLLRDYCAHKIREMEAQAMRLSVPEEEFRRQMREEAEKIAEESMLKRRSQSTNQPF